MRIAALDIGSNSFHLLVADVSRPANAAGVATSFPPWAIAALVTLTCSDQGDTIT